MLKTLIRPAMIFIPFVIGVLFPQAHVLNGEPLNVVRWCLVVMVFISALRIRFSDLRPRREHWMLLGVNVLMGVVPYFFLKTLLPAHQVLALTAFFVGITPTATAAPVVVAFLNGRIGFALTGFTISNICISLFLLALLPLVTGNLTADFIGNVDYNIVAVRAGAGGGHKNYEIKGSTGTKLHSLGQFTSVGTVTVENVTVSGGKSGLNLNNSTDMHITGFDFQGTEIGIRVGQGSGTPSDNTITIADSSLISSSVCTDLGDPNTALVLRGDAAKNIIITNSTIRNSNTGSYDIANKNSSNSGDYTLTLTDVDFGEERSLGGLEHATLVE